MEDLWSAVVRAWRGAGCTSLVGAEMAIPVVFIRCDVAAAGQVLSLQQRHPGYSNHPYEYEFNVYSSLLFRPSEHSNFLTGLPTANLVGAYQKGEYQ